MNTAGKVLLYSLALLTASNFEAFCQRKSKQRPIPKALLIQLFTNQNKLKMYEQAHATAKIAKEQRTTAEVNELIIEDYNTDFSYCPVYYFYDTNAHLVKEHRLEGVLLGKDLQPAKNLAFPSQDTTYVIAYWGKMVPEPMPTIRANDAAINQVGNNLVSSRTHMVLMTHNYKTLGQIRGKLRRVTKDNKAAIKKANGLYHLTAKKMSNKFIEKFL
jgi:hypothetical protein